MKIENTKVFNFEGAFRGMRNPLDSWNKSDSDFGMFKWDDDGEDPAWAVALSYLSPEEQNAWEYEADLEVEKEIEKHFDWLLIQGLYNATDYEGCYAYIGKKDLELAQRLIKAGPEHRKFLRQIFVSFDITAPFYWWKEFDTYKVGTVANSCSTMHKLTSYPIDIDNFEIEDFNPDLIFWTNDNGDSPVDYEIKDHIEDHMFFLEKLRQKYLETKDKRYWKELVRWLPEGWLQKRTITLNYENLRSMYSQRKNHKLSEWHYFCDWIKTSLPYAEELITYGLDDAEN